MTADEASMLLDNIASRQTCVMCGATDPPTKTARIGTDAVAVHDGCPATPPGRVDVSAGKLSHADAMRALRAVCVLHGQTVPPHGATVYNASRLPPHLVDRLQGVHGVSGAAFVVEYRDPDAPGAGAAEWDSRSAAQRVAMGTDATWLDTEGTGLVVVRGPKDVPQRPQASPDGGGDRAPARHLPVVPWRERVRVVTGADPLTRAAASLVVGVAFGAAGLSEPHVEVVDGDVVLAWHGHDVTATATVRDGGTRTLLWCNDGGPHGWRDVEVQTLDLSTHGTIPAWWLDTAMRCTSASPSELPWRERLPPLPGLSAAARDTLYARILPALAVHGLPAAVVRPLAGGVDMHWRSMRSDGTTPSPAWLTIRAHGLVRVWREDDYYAEELSRTDDLPAWWIDTVRRHAW